MPIHDIRNKFFSSLMMCSLGVNDPCLMTEGRVMKKTIKYLVPIHARILIVAAFTIDSSPGNHWRAAVSLSYHKN
jgi:hypothetical protein